MSDQLNTPSEAVVTVWIRLMRSQQAALIGIERAFRAAGLKPLAWYDALWELERVGEAGLRPIEIERRVLVAQSNISRLVDKLESEGLVARRPHPEDGRAQIIAITDAGRAMRGRMWPVYAKAIRAAIGEHLSNEDAGTLSSLLEKLPQTPIRGSAPP